MLCDQCCNHLHQHITMLLSGCANMLAHGCDGGECDYRLRKRFDEHYGKWVTKIREEHNNNSPRD